MTRFPETPADAIPGYKILKELHRGGQGVVYQALQLSTKRKVALKVMLEGPFASPASRRRFEREIELIGSLRHPHIVAIFDSGTADGRFYYAMEYIRGLPLTTYVQRRNLGVNDVLALMQRVCEAVDFAHQKGVIHRDLKPGNILVDENGDPHVLDFGLAKTGGTDAGDTAESMLVSVTGQVMGTLPYMSPEHAAGRPDQIDMRSDVYALGVVLYELLTGQYPYEVAGQMADVLRNIQEAEPKRPSTIRRQVNDEVETIILKALSKEKPRRYITAGALATDLQRFLAGDPIDAKRDSALYVLRKTLRRYKAPAAIVAGFVVVIVAGLAVSLSMWSRAESLARENQKRADQNATLLADVYAGQIGTAQAAYESGSMRRLADLLDGCSSHLRGWEWAYLDYRRTLDRGSSRLLGRHERLITSVAFSPNGKQIASTSAGTLLLWDAATGRQRQHLAVSESEETGFFTPMAFSHTGKYMVKRKTAKSRLTRALRMVTRWCQVHRHQPIAEQHRTLSRKLKGHFAYYGITGNGSALSMFHREVTRTWRKWLARRHRRGGYPWPRFTRLLERYTLPRPVVVHSVYRTAANP